MSTACPHRHLTLSQRRLTTHNQLFAAAELRLRLHLCFFRSQSRFFNASRSRHDKKAAGAEDDHAESIPWRRRNKEWSPYSDEGRNDLKGLLNDFQSFGPLEGPPEGKYKAVRPVNLPQSPLLKKTLGRPQKIKREPLQSERALQNDPWAVMLAAPIRQCHATHARLPVSLLTNWGLMKSPKNGDVYVLPDQLADLDKLDQMGSRQVEQMARDKDKAVYPAEPSEIVKRQTAKDPESPKQPYRSLYPLSPSVLNPGNSPAIRILPSYPIMTFLEDHLLQNDNQGDPNKPRSTKPGSVSKIMPQKWRERIARAQHYENNRKEVERETGLKDFRDEIPEASIDIKAIKWQSDIKQRLLDILRMRVLICVKKMVLLECSSERRRRLRTVAAMPQILDQISRVLREEDVHELSLAEEVEASTEDKSAVDQVEATLAAEDIDQQDGDHQLHTRGPASQEEDISGLGSTTEEPTPRPPAARFFLHLTNDALHSTLFNSPQSQLPGAVPTTYQDESGAVDQKVPTLIPPLIPSPAQNDEEVRHNPVFPMRAMLGDQRYTDFLDVLRPYEKLVSGDPGDGEHLLMFKANAAYADVLVNELWRLWRYSGGRKCTMISEGEVLG